MPALPGARAWSPRCGSARPQAPLRPGPGGHCRPSAAGDDTAMEKRLRTLLPRLRLLHVAPDTALRRDTQPLPAPKPSRPRPAAPAPPAIPLAVPEGPRDSRRSPAAFIRCGACPAAAPPGAAAARPGAASPPGKRRPALRRRLARRAPPRGSGGPAPGPAPVAPAHTPTYLR